MKRINILVILFSIFLTANLFSYTVISNISPYSHITVTNGEIYSINYFTDDSVFSNVTTLLYYNTNTSLSGATLICSNYTLIGSNYYNWDTTSVPQGTYYIIGQTFGSTNSPISFSFNTITISNSSGTTDNPPTLSNISPLFSNQTVYSGSSYQIQFYIDDDNATNMDVTFFYGPITNGGTYITNHFYPTGSTNFYSWDTTGVTEGSYYIVITTSDGVNSYITNHSAFKVVIVNTNTNTTTTTTNTNNTTVDTTPPAIPNGLKITTRDKELFLHWNNNIEPDLKGYYIYRKEKKETEYKLINFVQKSNFYIDANLQNGTYYSYKLRAVDTNDNISDFSAGAGAMPVKIENKNDINLIFSDNKITPGDDEDIKISIASTNSAYSGKATIYIYDVSMRLIKKIEISNLSPEEASVLEWDLKDTNNIKIPTGVYFIWIVGNNWKKVKPIYVIR